MHHVDAYRMIRHRTAEDGFKQKLGCHAFRTTGITAYVEPAARLKTPRRGPHKSPRTSKLYDRTGDQITLNEVERITI